MHLRGIDFGAAWGASGVQGFFGEGYPFHSPWKLFGLDFRGMTFVGKTTTLEPRLEPRKRKGNMPLDTHYRPVELLPACIVVKPIQGVVLNAVGLSGPGAETLFRDGRWQYRKGPFFISFMSVGGTVGDREEELVQFVRCFKGHKRFFRAPVGLQLNFSCPNVGAHFEGLVEEVRDALSVAEELGVPCVPKFNILLPVEAACEIAEHRACDAVCVSNTVPWGALPDEIPWGKLFGSLVSPLAHLGGGGLSGKPLLPLVARWVTDARRLKIPKPINAGGGILCPADAICLIKAGAASVSLGSIAILRPWRVQGTISTVSPRAA